MENGSGLAEALLGLDGFRSECSPSKRALLSSSSRWRRQWTSLVARAVVCSPKHMTGSGWTSAIFPVSASQATTSDPDYSVAPPKVAKRGSSNEMALHQGSLGPTWLRWGRVGGHLAELGTLLASG